MPRRRELKSIASGMAMHCVSRNNDIGGYWALGILYRFALEAGADCLRVDIMSDEDLPEALVLFRRNFRSHYGDKDYRFRHFIAGLIVEFEFESSSRTETGDNSTQGKCHIHVIDDMGKRWSAMACTYCNAHDPAHECKSTR